MSDLLDMLNDPATKKQLDGAMDLMIEMSTRAAPGIAKLAATYHAEFKKAGFSDEYAMQMTLGAVNSICQSKKS